MRAIQEMERMQTQLEGDYRVPAAENNGLWMGRWGKKKMRWNAERSEWSIRMNGESD